MMQRTGTYPLSFAQERLWFLDRLETWSTAYVVEVSLRLEGALHVASLERALSEIVRRHDTLRTTFPTVDGAPVQRVAPFTGFTLPVEDLSGLAAPEREHEVQRRAREHALRKFDLAAGPLLRTQLLRVGDDDHVLLIGTHHVISDMWSLTVLFRELSVLYGAYRAGHESTLTALPMQYGDYAVWQRAELHEAAIARELQYWEAHLSGAPPLMDLPTDHPRPPVQSHRAAREEFECPPALLRQLQAVGRRERATLFMVLLAAFKVLLSKYSGSDDIVVGTTIAGRTRTELESLVGFFANTLALRTDVSGDPSFRDLLCRVRDVMLGAYQHQTLPFDRLVTALQPERSLSHSPLFQMLLVVHQGDGLRPELPGLQVRKLSTGIETEPFDLSLAFRPRESGLLGRLSYSTDLFEPDRMIRMCRHFEQLLEQVAADPDRRLSSVRIGSAAERVQVVETWNSTATTRPTDGTIHELIEAQASATPDAVAVRAGDGRLTYAALNARANQLAYALRAFGVGPDARVALCLDRGLDFVVALLAVLKAGGAYVPLDPAYPAERLRYMLTDSEPVAVLTRGRPEIVVEWQAERPAERRVIDMRADAPSWRDQPIANPPRTAAGPMPSHLAYVIYTSGSTGEAKGVAVTHANLVHSTRARHDAYERPPEHYLLLSPVSFDSSVAGLFWTLVSGGTLHLPPADLARDPVALAREVRQVAISHLLCLPSLYALLLEQSERSGGLPSVRVVIVAGERCPVSLLARHDAVVPEATLYNEYGPTEGTVWSTVHQHRRGDDTSPVPIGRPIANARVYCLDTHHEPVPVGVVGELYIGGAGVARGYLRRPALTASRFLPNPFVHEPGAASGRMYMTGDLGRWRSDGSIEFLGRNDFQIKIRGFRIEPGEIEAHLIEQPRVRAAAVVARADKAGDQQLVAYYTSTDTDTGTKDHNHQADAEILRAFLSSRLPEYMVPTAFVSLEQLPLMPNGKLDMKALPMPAETPTAGGYVAPQTVVEELLAGIWADVLQVDRVSTSDSFFALGGHSLRAIRIVSRLRETFGVELPVRTLFEKTTLSAVAAAVEDARRIAAPVLPPVTRVDRTQPLPVSFAQERLWFLDRLVPGSATYHVPIALRLTGALDVLALERALGEIVRRHEPLRTTFAETEGTPVQVIAPFTEFALRIEDLSTRPPAARDAEVEGRARETATQPFDLGVGPLVRVALLRLGPTESVLLLTLHHIVIDGWSLSVFFRELSTLYAASRTGQASPLPALAVQYADYAVWQRTHLADAVLARDLTYWQAQLADLPELLPLPTDHPRPAVQTYRGASARVELPAALREQLEALARREGVTLYMVLLAAFQLLLGKYAGTEDVAVGSPIAGRPRRELEPLIGFFVNTLVLRTNLSGNPRLRDLFHRVRAVTLAAYEHQDLPFEQLVGALQPVRSLSHAPLFQVMFALHDGDEWRLTLPGVEARRLTMASETEKFDLSLVLTPHADGLRGRLSYRTDLFERRTIDRLLQQFERVLAQLIADPDRRASEISLLDEAERHRVVEAWNQTDVPYPADRCIHQLFAAQAAAGPDAIAAVCGEQALTYRALDARTSALAQRLIALGVGPDVRVGLCVDRGLSLVVAVLGILKAGGAYVALDANYPAERLTFMIADAGVKVVLTEERLRDALPVLPDVAIEHVDAADAIPPMASMPALRHDTKPGNLAFVIYTSGSTGQPKGVGIEHRGVVRLVCGANYARFAAEDVMVHAAPMAFDASTLELWGPLLNGGRVVLAPGGSPPELDALGATITRHGATTVFLTTALFQAMVEDQLDSFRDVQQLMTGGEAALPEVMQTVRRHHPGLRLVNCYGPTENTTLVTCYTVSDDWRGGAVPIGTPVSNTQAYVLDAQQQLVPVGVPGELYAGGVGVARGYLGRPGLTAERFLPDPFGPAPGARLYRTGDRVRWRADGALDFLGRVDAQVKVRGFRIEPGEVETAIAAIPGIRDVRVMAREDTVGDRRLIAYIVGDVEQDRLRNQLRRGLPDYMVPSSFVYLEGLPLTPTGKLDVKALPAPQYAQGAQFVAPRTDLEETVASVWRSILAVPEVGTRSNFFDLGGTSLQLIRVHRRLRELRGDLRITDLFRYTTVEELATYLAAAAPPDTSELAASRARAKERRAALRVRA